jgi:hypothetical protein
MGLEPASTLARARVLSEKIRNNPGKSTGHSASLRKTACYPHPPGVEKA